MPTSKQKTQIVLIHGGTTFDSYPEYLRFLKTVEVKIEKLHARNEWKMGFARALGSKFDVLQPRMPNGSNAKYSEWKIWFERIVPFLQNDVILVGHSLGGIFLAKYLSENDFPHKVCATILLAAPFTDTPDESLATFRLTKSLKKFAKQGGKIVLYASKDDHVVPFSHMQKYKHALPKAISRIFKDRGHFNQPKFPELVVEIKRLAK